MDIGLASGDDVVRDDGDEECDEPSRVEVPLANEAGDAGVEAFDDSHDGLRG